MIKLIKKLASIGGEVGIAIGIAVCYVLFYGLLYELFPKEMNSLRYVIEGFAFVATFVCCIASKKNKTLKYSLVIIFLFSFIIAHREFLQSHFNDIKKYIMNLTVLLRILLTLAVTTVVIAVFELIKYRQVIMQKFFSLITKIYKAISLALKNICMSIKNKKRIRYFLIIITTMLATSVIISMSEFSIQKQIIVMGIALCLGIIVSIFFNEQISAIREHPYKLTLFGLCVVVLVYICSQIPVYNEIKLNTSDTMFNQVFLQHVYINFFSVHIYVIIISLFILIALVMVFTSNLTTLQTAVGISAEAILFNSVVILLLNSHFNDMTKKLVIIMLIADVIAIIAITVVLTISKMSWTKLWEKYFDKKIYVPFVIVVLVLWVLWTLIMVIIRWTAFDNLEEFIDSIMECATYSAIAIMGIAAVTGIAYMLYIIGNSIFKDKKDGDKKEFKEHISGSTIILMGIFLLMLLVSLFETKFGFINKQIPNLSDGWKIPLNIIKYLYTGLFISYIAMMLFYYAINARTIRACRNYLQDETTARKVYNEYFKKKLKNPIHIAETPSQESDEQPTAEQKNSGQVSKVQETAPNPNNISDGMGLMIAIFTFEIRNATADVISALLKPVKSNGLVWRAMRDLIDLFIGGDGDV